MQMQEVSRLDNEHSPGNGKFDGEQLSSGGCDKNGC
jgi:hypothetical protein